MALIQLGSLISNIKGSIGGTTFSNVRAGTAAKRRLPGRQAVTQSQARALSDSKVITVLWNALNPVQKANFNSYASVNTSTDRYGVTKRLTGFQWFKSLCYYSYYFTGAGITAPPSFSTPAAIPTFSIDLNTENIVLEWSTPIDPEELYIMVFATTPTRQLNQLQRGKMKLLDIRGVDYSSVITLTSAWEAATGLDYGLLRDEGQFSVSVMVIPISKASFVSGQAQLGIGSVLPASSGIGSAIIGSTFVIG